MTRLEEATMNRVKMNSGKFYTIQTFGCPTNVFPVVSTFLDHMIRRASEAKGSGTCTCARVYEHDRRTLALTADIGRIRKGERVVFEA